MFNYYLHSSSNSIKPRSMDMDGLEMDAWYWNTSETVSEYE